VIADLYAKTGESNLFGIDVTDGKVRDINEIEIYDAWETKSWAMKLCIDAVITILKVDQIIMSKPAGGPNMNQAARRPDGYDE
jgi:T-complex protein 1 subunit theta